jgi:hypothetical protein
MGGAAPGAAQLVEKWDGAPAVSPGVVRRRRQRVHGPADPRPHDGVPHRLARVALSPSDERYAVRAVTAQRALVALAALVGVLAVVVGVIYLTVDAKSLPSVLGKIHGDNAHRSLRGIVALVAGAVLLFGSVGTAAYGPARRR